MDRTLLITDIFPPDIGGPATFIDQLGRHLAQAGHAVTVVCTSTQSRDDGDRTRPFCVRRIVRRSPSRWHSLRVRAILAQEILTHRWILSNGLEYPTYQVCSLLRRPYILKVVGDSAWETARNTGLTRLSIDEFQMTPSANTGWEHLTTKRTRFVRGATMVLTPSHYLRHMVIGWGVPRERAITVYNGIPLGEFEAYQPRRRAGDRFEIVYVGRIANWKGVETLLHAVVDLPQVHITIVGDGPEQAALAELAQRLDLEGVVTFTGAQPRHEVQARVVAAQVLVLVSSYEGLSHTLLEALAMGVPCIASDRGGNPEVIRDGENGLLVPYNDVPRLRAAIQQLQADEVLRYRLACQAKASSRQFDFETTVRETTRILLAH